MEIYDWVKENWITALVILLVILLVIMVAVWQIMFTHTIEVHSGGWSTGAIPPKVIVDGVELALPYSRGINVAQIGGDGKLVEFKTFDTYGNFNAVINTLAYLKDGISPDATYIAMLVFDEATNQKRSPGGVDLYKKLDKYFPSFSKLVYRGNYAIIKRVIPFNGVWNATYGMTDKNGVRISTKI